MRLDEPALEEYTDQFDHEAFRHECIDGIGADSDTYVRWLAGEPVDPEVAAPWGRWVRDQLARGAAVRRLRSLAGPPTEYVRFEAEVFYAAHVAAGEEIRVLELPAGAELMPEFWMLDGARAALMFYDEAGRFTHGETLDPGPTEELRRARDAAWARAEPFTSWWARHPEYHRAGV